MSLTEDTPASLVPDLLGNLPLRDKADHLRASTAIRIKNSIARLRGRDLQAEFAERVQHTAQSRYKFPVTPRTLKALEMVDRTDFIDPAFRVYARQTVPLPIGKEQTTSSPDTIAVMIDLLDIQNDSDILEIGSGSGYTAIVMAQITNGQIVSLEIKPEIRTLAQRNVKQAEQPRVTVADSRNFWAHSQALAQNQHLQTFPDQYDRVICCAEIENALEAERYLEKLTPNGKFLAPMKGEDGQTYFYTYTHEKGWVGHPINPKFVPHMVN